jgi:hypothetical protein
MSFASFLRFWAVAAKRKFISCPFGPRKRKSVEPEDAFHISEVISTFLPLAPRDKRRTSVWRSRAPCVASDFMNVARDLVCRRVRAALGLERAGLAAVLDHRAFFRHPSRGRAKTSAILRTARDRLIPDTPDFSVPASRACP